MKRFLTPKRIHLIETLLKIPFIRVVVLWVIRKRFDLVSIENMTVVIVSIVAFHNLMKNFLTFENLEFLFDGFRPA